MISPFILSVAKCNAVFHYSLVCFAGVGSDIIPFLYTRRMGLPSQVLAPYIVYSLDSPFTVCCVVVLERGGCSLPRNGGMGGGGGGDLRLSSSSCSSLSQPGRWLTMGNALTINMDASAKHLKPYGTFLLCVGLLSSVSYHDSNHHCEEFRLTHKRSPRLVI